MDLATLKVELKAWEKEFKAQHGREPSKADIKAVPAIADKYRLYSKSRTDKSSASQHAPKPVQAESAALLAPGLVTPSKPKRLPTTAGAVESFKTPSKRTPVETNGIDAIEGNTQFAFAPSPSRLRALAASRSFSGSPNKKGGQASEAGAHRSSNAPANLGKSFVLPPTIDTPRTKAKRWLAGEAVSPPAKLRYNGTSTSGIPQASTSANARHTNGRQSSIPPKGSFWQKVEEARGRSATPNEDSQNAMRVDASEPASGAADNEGSHEADVVAPSPAKPRLNREKGKSRQRLDLFDSSQAVQPSRAIEPAQSLQSTSTSKASASASSENRLISNFFSKAPTLASSTNGTNHGEAVHPSQPGKTYVPGKSKSKKRTVVALAPMVAEDFDRDDKPAAMPTNGSSEVPRLQPSKGKGKGKQIESTSQDVQDLDEKREQPNKKLRRSRQAQSPSAPHELHDAEPDAAEDELLQVTGSAEEEMEQDDYDVRDLSDDYETYRPRNKRDETPSTQMTHPNEAPEPVIDESMDPSILSLLSLKTSPVKNRRLQLEKKREDTYRQLLQEPTYIKQSKRRITGLEDLADQEEEDQAASEGEDRFGDECTAQRKRQGQSEEVLSDDDWASDPDGWKDLGDGEMPEDF